MTPRHRFIPAALAAALALVILGGCASPQRSAEVLSWVESNEQQKAKLEAEGFPQYVGGN